MIIIMVFIVMMSSYLIGSMCSAIIVCRLCQLPDPRSQGSQNPGATNVLRLSGKKYAIIVLLGDCLKGLIPLLVIKACHMPTAYLGYAGLAVVLGHIYPIFFQFKGGKGVATTLGVLLGFDGLLGVMALGTWLMIAAITRYSSLSAMIALILSPLYVWFMPTLRPLLLPLLMMVVIVVYQHRDNIQRLIQGKESKIKFTSGENGKSS